MTRVLLAAAAAAALALTGAASADGCVEDYLMQEDAAVRYVEVHDDGSVHVYPHRVVASADQLVTRTRAFVDCAV